MSNFIAFNAESLPPSWIRLTQEFSGEVSKITEILLMGWELKNSGLDEGDLLSYLTDRFLEDVIVNTNRDQEVQLAHLAASAALIAITKANGNETLTRGLKPLLDRLHVVIESVKVGMFDTVVVELSDPTDKKLDILPCDRATSLKRLAKLKDTLDSILSGKEDNTDELLIEELSNVCKGNDVRSSGNAQPKKTTGEHRTPRRRSARNRG